MLKVGFIGGGAMAEAIIAGMVRGNSSYSEWFFVSDLNKERTSYLKDNYGINIANSNSQLINEVDVVFLAVKPATAGEVIKPLAQIWDKQVLVSILAGTKIDKITSLFGFEVPIIRVMPNTPSLVGSGMSALCKNNLVLDEQFEYVKNIFETVGEICLVDEGEINAITGISGSGPAYIFMVIEALIDAGVKMGLKRDLARQVAVQTVIGSANMVHSTDKHPAQLKDQVTSPGGTTIAAVSVLEEKGLRSALIKAVETASLKAEEIDKNNY
ncbi:pyrroline-5-carboxylate reductase [Desulfitispora alkaliphila]|uniref:pyrroline-5-carboxylate reductase n=1 Tax=Desulfitispora alkaliphila TaxID=622674 RepID=UPI003D1A3DDC